MDLNRLRAFMVVAEELNFRRSAEILGMSQPPLTRLIAGLEDELGTPLFERTTRRVRLTAAGIVLLKEAREITAALERIEINVRGAARLREGAVKIGFSTTAFMARFPIVVEEFEKMFPKIRLDLRQDTTPAILKGVRAGTYDLGFVESVTAAPELESLQIHEENLGVLLPKGHPLARRKEIEFVELAGETIILHHKREAAEFHARISKLIRGLPKRPLVYIKGENESCPILVATGKGVSLTIAGARHVAESATKFVPIRNMFMPVSMFWLAENERPAVRTMISFVAENKFVKPPETQCLVLA